MRYLGFGFCLIVASALSNQALRAEREPQEKLFDKVFDQGHTPFHNQPIALEGHVLSPESDGSDEYRLRLFGSENTYILKLRPDQLAWASQCEREPVKIEGIYKDGGIVEPKKLSHWYLDDVAWQMVCECNRYRALHGLAPLQPARDLLQTAFRHSYNMQYSYGFRHGGTSGWSGENIAMGQTDASSVTNDWYNSSGHRANMLNPGYQYIGVGYHNGMWTQQFR